MAVLKILRTFGLSVLLLAILAGMGGIARADSFNPADYQILQLGTLNNSNDIVKAYAINDNSQIVGVATPTSGRSAAFIFNAVQSQDGAAYSGRMTAIDPTARTSTAYAINNAGQTVGDNLHGTGKKAVSSSYMAHNGVITSMVRDGLAYGINERGQVVGTAGGQAYMWSSDGGRVNLGTNLRTAVDINYNGVVVGQTTSGSGYVLDTQTGNLVTYSGMQMKAVDRHGAAIGTTSVGGVTRSYMIANGVITEIEPGSGAGTFPVEALSMNDKGLVVGSANGRAFVWDAASGMFDLNNLLPAGSGWDYLVAAEDINNLGQIVGWGIFNGKVRSFLLTRVAAVEASAVFMLIGSGLLVFLRYRQARQRQGA